MDRDRLIIQKSDNLRGEIVVPPSKSHTLRAIIFATLARGNSVIKNPLDCVDARFCIAACQKLGAEIRVSHNSATWFVKGTSGKIKTPKSEINIGNSGITLRFLSGILANCRGEAVITGDHSIRTNRPMQPMIEALKTLGVEARSANLNGFAPIIIRGPIIKSRTSVSGADSQFVSGLLIGSLLANQDIAIEVKKPGEKPWVGMTLYWFKKLGLKYENKNYKHYRIFGKQSIKGFETTIPADFSSAAYFIVAALISKDSKIVLKGLDKNDCQGDKEVINVLKRMGGRIFWRDNNLIVESSRLKGVEIDVNDFIDAVPILAVVGCYANSLTRIKNAAVARTKECNRLRVAVDELSKMGANIKEMADGLEIRKSVLNGAVVDSHDDHRMVFSLAIAALGASGTAKIRNVGCISKTIPNFVELMRGIGVKIRK